MITIRSFVLNEFQENTYILYDETRECVIIDPGFHHAAGQKKVTSFIEDNGLTPVKLLNTHCHIDHVLGNDFVIQKYNLSLYIHEGEIFTYKDTLRWTVQLGLPPLEVPEKVKFITEKDTITFGNSELKIFFTPGHSIASLTFYNPQQEFAIAGDVLFRESIGRTDLPGGDYDTLIRSIRNILFTWPDETKIFSGHGQPTTIGYEKIFNPFLKDR